MASNPFASPEASIHASPSMQSIQNTPYMVSSPSGLSQRRWVKAFKSRKVNIEEMQARTPYHETPKGRSELRWSYWIFVAGVMIGVAGAAAIFVRMWFSVPHHRYCLVLDEQFDSLDTSIWQHEVQVGGFGNGEFEWTTSNPENSFVEDGKLYIVPTLTSDKIGVNAVTDGYVVNLTRDGTCTGTTAEDCVIFSNNTLGNISIIPPIQSARLTTKLSKSIRFGRVEVKAKMPTGDWIWPAIWMMPRDSVYGDWPASGEIDIVESKGNAVQHVQEETRNTIRSSLHWGPTSGLDRYSKTTDVIKQSRNWYNEQSNVFGLEWDPKGISTWKGSRARNIFGQAFSKSFWQRGEFGAATDNGDTYTNPWANATYPNAAPFDQDFFLILNVAVGGTNGYFEDGAGKPWSNSGAHPANDFWAQRGLWEPSWPTDPKERGMVVEYVKMWRIAEPGEVCEA